MTSSVRKLAAINILVVMQFLSQSSYAGLIDFRNSEFGLVTTFSKTIESTGSLAGVTASFSNAMSESQISSGDERKDYFYL